MILAGRRINLVVYGEERGEVLGKFFYIVDGAEYTALKKHLASIIDRADVDAIFADTLEDIANLDARED